MKSFQQKYSYKVHITSFVCQKSTWRQRRWQRSEQTWNNSPPLRTSSSRFDFLLTDGVTHGGSCGRGWSFGGNTFEGSLTARSSWLPMHLLEHQRPLALAVFRLDGLENLEDIGTIGFNTLGFTFGFLLYWLNVRHYQMRSGVVLSLMQMQLCLVARSRCYREIFASTSLRCPLFFELSNLTLLNFVQLAAFGRTSSRPSCRSVNLSACYNSEVCWKMQQQKKTGNH
ncbi:Hypothetical_protein [Hexamita inflata]|uniref:Hypothetical_protein n=1 Tax=Hexamita inflata TaxID=28002 RepID=A0AA86NQX6_9EUKA|nr:Hypothetical protein HINF_LOCUS11863 [Hexamita inflata]